MAPLTKENLPRHELIGLQAVVSSSSNPTQVGIQGTIVDETRSTLTIFDGVSYRKIQKQGARFGFFLPNGSMTTVNGEKIRAKSAERVKGMHGGR